MTLRFPEVTVRVGLRSVATRFDDGAEIIAIPKQGDAKQARELGYRGSDEEAAWAMTRHHDLLHTLLAIARGEPYSRTLWAVAHDEPLDEDWVRYEEALVLGVQGLLVAAAPDA